MAGGTSSPSREDKALLVAMELLRQALGDNTAAVAANTQRTEAALERQARELAEFVNGARPAEADDGPQVEIDTVQKQESGAVGKVLDMLANKFASALAPLALFGSAVAAPISGLQTFLKAVQALAASLAPIFTPVSVLFSTAALAVSEVLSTRLAPVFEDWFDYILSEGIPAIERFVEWVLKAANAAWEFYNRYMPSKEDAAIGVGAGVGAALGGPIGAVIGGAIGYFVSGSDEEPAADPAAAADATADPAAARRSPRGIAGAALSDVLESLRLSLGPRASMGALESARSSAQMAALNNDPIDQRMLKNAIEQLKQLERIRRNTEARRGMVYVPGDGDFSRTDPPPPPLLTGDF